jgi:hypothetical protein
LREKSIFVSEFLKPLNILKRSNSFLTDWQHIGLLVGFVPTKEENEKSVSLQKERFFEAYKIGRRKASCFNQRKTSFLFMQNKK